MYRIRCAEVWGGVGNQDQELSSAGIDASLYSVASDGRKGGDIYYLSVCGNDHLTRIAIADVVGHGEAVSAVSESMYHALVERMSDSSNARVLSGLNALVAQRGLEAMATAALVGFYSCDSNLCFAYAGHAPALMQCAGEKAWRRVQPAADQQCHVNAPLGVVPDGEFDEGQVHLSRGDRLFLYTDGVSEARSAQHELFGERRLIQVLNGCTDQPIQSIKHEVLDALRAHTGGHLGHDDVTVLAAEIR